MLQILIVRHANPIYETDSITEEGEKQAVQLAGRITRLEKIDAIYVSPLGRAIRTAEHISKTTGIKPEVLSWLREVDKGNFPWTKPHNEYLRKGEFADPIFWEDGYWAGKELREVYKEVSSGLDKLLSEYNYVRDGFIYKVEEPDIEKTICLVCHGGVSIVILSHLLQWHLPLAYAHIGILETGIARILFKSQGENDAVPVLISINDVSHLDDRLWQKVVNRQKNHKVAM
jgi:probable phosphoglycerate mutase